ncbi:MAG: PKD domain-containing protein, partial [Planctomycetota bacterium]
MKRTILAACAVLLAAFSFGIPAAMAAEQAATLQISNGNDDYKETADGTSNKGDRDHDLWSAAEPKQAYRFAGCPIPPRATVLEASIQFYPSGSTNISKAANGYAVGEASGNAPAWTGVTNEITSAPKTAATVTIQNVPAWTASVHNTLADVAPIVQELVNRADYASGNAVKIFLVGTVLGEYRQAKTYEGNAANAPRLVLRWSDSAPPPLNVAPVADVTASPTSGTVPLDVSFGGSLSSDSDGTIVEYRWNFGDGSAEVAGTSTTAFHTYAAAGTYTASLTVKDNGGLTGVDTIV